MCCQQCIFVFSLSQVKQHKVVSLFSGVLGLELGLGGCGAQSWSAFKDVVFYRLWLQRFIEPLAFALLLDFGIFVIFSAASSQH
jgi:hypothetical protein